MNEIYRLKLTFTKYTKNVAKLFMYIISLNAFLYTLTKSYKQKNPNGLSHYTKLHLKKCETSVQFDLNHICIRPSFKN